MLPQNLSTTQQINLEALIADGIQEGPNLDFKRQLPTQWDNSEKHKLIADVVAFANAAGGDIIFGIEEGESAQAARLVPFDLPSSDQEIRRIQDIILNQIEPRVSGIEVHSVPLSVDGQSGWAVVIRVPQSWAGPHRAKTNSHFYIRSGLRNHQLDVPEIKGLFLRSLDQAQALRNFRSDRIGKILIGETPARLEDGPKLIVHFAPADSVMGLVQVNPTLYTRDRYLPILGHSSSNARLNIDGAWAAPHSVHGREPPAYSLFFRNGYFESVWAFSSRASGREQYLPSVSYEESVIKLLIAYREEFRALGFRCDVSVMLSLVNVKGLELFYGDRSLDAYQALFDRSVITIPDIFTESEVSAAAALKPAFDLVWQAAGIERSLNFDETGNWCKGKLPA